MLLIVLDIEDTVLQQRSTKSMISISHCRLSGDEDALIIAAYCTAQQYNQYLLLCVQYALAHWPRNDIHSPRMCAVL